MSLKVERLPRDALGDLRPAVCPCDLPHLALKMPHTPSITPHFVTLLSLGNSTSSPTPPTPPHHTLMSLPAWAQVCGPQSLSPCRSHRVPGATHPWDAGAPGLHSTRMQLQRARAERALRGWCTPSAPGRVATGPPKGAGGSEIPPKKHLLWAENSPGTQRGAPRATRP